MESIELRVQYLDQAIFSFDFNISAIRRGNPFTIKHSKNGEIILRKLLEKRYQDKFRMQNFTKEVPTYNVSKQLEAAILSCEYTHLKNLLGISKDSIKKLISQINFKSGSSLRTRYSFLSFELIMMMYESIMSINEVQNYLYDFT